MDHGHLSTYGSCRYRLDRQTDPVAGSVKLGPIEIANDVVSISRRLGSKQQIRFADLRQVGLKAGYVHFDTDSKTMKTPLRDVPNGLYLPEILRAAGWRG